MGNPNQTMPAQPSTHDTCAKIQQYIDTFRLFDDSLDDYLYIYDLTTARIYFTEKIWKKFPLPPPDGNSVAFSDWSKIVYPKDRIMMHHYRHLLEAGVIDSFDINCRILNRSEKKVWVRIKGSLRNDEDTGVRLIVGWVSEVIASGMVDTLTGLFCTEKFLRDMNDSFHQSDGYLMLLDIDNLQTLNLTQGRTHGDAVMKQVAGTLDAHTNYPVELYRLDGDSFAVNFVGGQKEDVDAFYESIKQELESVCTLSAGVVRYQAQCQANSEAIYLYAEHALNHAKRSGKNKLVFFSAANYQKNLAEISLLSEMSASIQDQFRGFSLEYQPQINPQEFRLYGVEALLRYDSPSRGRVSPAEFIPLLEQARLICPVGEWALRQAINQCQTWRSMLPQLHMAVNVSYVQLQQDGVTDLVLNILNEAGLPGDALTLELTENLQLQDYLYFNKIFYSWKQRGIRISIDDFGTGYSSLSYLKKIEIDEVKIDRCFVDRVHHNAYNFRLLSNMIELAHSANISVCCEGVETVEELMALQELHPDLIQGYFFAKPCTPERFDAMYIQTDSKAYQDRTESEEKLLWLTSGESQPLLDDLRKEEIGNITESMDEVVYVSDPETYELYYLNAAGRRLTGIYDYKGCKCYKVFAGLDAPCDYCTNHLLSKDKFLIWERENTFLNRHFILKDKLIPWHGKLARVELAIDITEKEILSQSIQQRLNAKRAIVDSCKILARESNPDISVPQVLNTLGSFCSGDRAFILMPCEDSSKWQLLWEWCSEETMSRMDNFPSQLDPAPSVDTQQYVSAPIPLHNHPAGLLVVEHPQVSQELPELVETAAYFLGHCMNRKNCSGCSGPQTVL